VTFNQHSDLFYTQMKISINKKVTN